jgi:hypothetical protein
MPDENLLKYIQDGLAQGRTEDVIRSMLISVGWAPKDVDDAFVFAKTGQLPNALSQQPTAVISTTVTTITSPNVPVVTQVNTPLSAPKKFSTKLIVIVVLSILLFGGGSAFAYYYMQSQSSPQEVLAAMFKTGFSGITSVDNATSISIDIHMTPASSTSSSTMGSINPYAGALLGATSSSEFNIRINSSGTFVMASGNNRNIDEMMDLSLDTVGSGKSVIFNLGGEVRAVDGAAYINISTIPNLGIFDATPFKGKWIKLSIGSSTQNIAVPSTTISDADIQKLTNAAEQMISITKILPDETVGGVANHHYQYVLDKAGVKNMALTMAGIAAESVKNTSSSFAASTTLDGVSRTVEGFTNVFTSMGGEIWIGKTDHYPHQFTLSLAFATTTSFGMVSGTVNVTSTHSNMNGSQIVVAPDGAVDIQTVMQSIASPTSTPIGSVFDTTQVNGRDARRISDLHEVQNALELYYNRCGYYPGVAASPASCPTVNTQVSTFAGLSSALIRSSIGVKQLPNDPISGETYYYGTTADGSQYVLGARLESAVNSVFSHYNAPSLSKIKATGLTSCVAPMYCLDL